MAAGNIDSPSGMDALRQHFAAGLQEAAEPLIQKAVADIEQQLRERIGLMAVAVAQRYSMETHGQEVLIRVRIEDLRR